jgi:hypothetical protein
MLRSLVLIIMVNRFNKYLVATFALVQMSCHGKQPTMTQIVGRWSPTPASALNIKSETTRCQITFAKDGTFVTSGVPDYLTTTSNLAAGNLVSGSGKWSLDKNQGRYVVELDFDIMNGAATQFHTSSLMLMLLAVIPCCIAGSVKKGESGLSFRRGRQLQQGELQRANPVERETCPEGANGYSSLPKASSKSRIVNLR